MGMHEIPEDRLSWLHKHNRDDKFIANPEDWLDWLIATSEDP